MKHRLDAWTRSWVTWTLPLGFLIVQIICLVVYDTGFSGRNAVLQERVDARQQELDRYLEVRQGYDGFLERAAQVEERTAWLYHEQFATEAERFTVAVREVKTLAERAGLEPTTLSYPDTVVETHHIVVRSFVFGVEGTYEQLRTLVNLLELSDQFLILDAVQLSEGGGEERVATRLRIGLQISTVFAQPETDVPELSSLSDAERDVSPEASASDDATDEDASRHEEESP